MEELYLMQDMSDQQKMMFMSKMSAERKDSTTGVLLALFLGGLGAHRFYLGQTGLGILYVVFFWTFLPALVALIECFLMPERIRQYNAAKASEAAMQIRLAFPSRSAAPATAIS